MEYKKKVILITEDEPQMLKILTDTLSEHAFETIQAKNGQQGLTLALQTHPDLIIVDLLMPTMDGLTMLKNLRDDTWGKTVPVIILTNVNPESNDTLQAIVTHQPAYYFVKSEIKLESIVEKIEEVLVSAKPANQNSQ